MAVAKVLPLTDHAELANHRDPPSALMLSIQTPARLRHALVVIGLVTVCITVAAPPTLGKARGICVDSKHRLCAKDVSVTSSIQRTDSDACHVGRRKLWVEGQGWIVRRVTTCEAGSQR